MKIQKKKKNLFFFGGGRGQGRCEQRSEVFVKIPKKILFFGEVGGGGRGRVGGVRVDVIGELKFLGKFTKKFGGGGGVGLGGGGGSVQMA